MNKIPLVVIVGPTAVGKTDISIQAAKTLNGEIISADSMQIYRYMNIGTAKPTLYERQDIPHHMIDIVDPNEEFSVALFQKGANQSIKEIYDNGKLPILSGGTGLYVNSILFPMNFSSSFEDADYRNHLNELSSSCGNTFVHNLLNNVDPKTAARLHPNDNRRVIRALEVHHLTGKTMAEYQQDFNEIETPYELILLGLTMDRQKLYDRINLRVDTMIETGLIDEVKALLDMGYSKNLISMQGLGYKEVISYIDGLVTLAETKEILKRATRRFAKRQQTWFRREKRILWLDTDSFSDRQEMLDWIILHIKKRLSL